MSTAEFKDHFSDRASLYARYRPTYPDRLFALLAEAAPSRSLAWDCATGNGQAARGLARHFERVVATDASEHQIANARAVEGVEYRVGRESDSGLEPASVDLVTVAQAFHWLDPERFWPEARRVLRPRGVAAVWMYRLPRVAPEIDTVVEEFYVERIGPWWPDERVHVENCYADLPFPLERMAMPELAMEESWTCEQMCGYLRTWSATRRFMADRGCDPVEPVERRLGGLWGPEKRVVVWPLVTRVGRPLPH